MISYSVGQGPASALHEAQPEITIDIEHMVQWTSLLNHIILLGFVQRRCLDKTGKD